MAYGIESYILPKTPLLKLKAWFLRSKAPQEPPQIRFRKALEKLGPTFIKFGQVLSTRTDLLPESWTKELMKLRDEVPPTPWEEVERILNHEYPEGWRKIFAEIDPAPVGSASIAQVYRGRLTSGDEVAIKIRRPGIEEVVELDLAILMRIAQLIHRHIEELRIYNIPQMVEEFGFTIKREMDFRIEAANAERLKPVLEKHDIHVPKIFWQNTTSKILVTEFVKGQKLEDWEGSEDAKCDLAKKLALAFIDQVVEAGIFHADPHPANIIVTETGIYLIDFGMVGFLDQDMRDFVTKIFLYTVNRDYDAIVESYKRMGLVERIDERRFKLELMGLVDPYLTQSLERINIGEIVQKIIEISIKYGVKFPSEFLMLGRSMLLMDGLVKQLCPKISVLEIVAPHAKKIASRKAKPENLLKELKRIHQDAQKIKEDFLLLTQLATETALRVKEEGVRVKVLQDEIRDRELRKLGDRLVATTVSIGLFLASLFSWGFKIGWAKNLPVLPAILLLGSIILLGIAFLL
ncbi:ABC1 kinase family protein [Thermosulfidibacter takaii]|uniref:ABC1 kinase family protein n=1 Tax=Thermosulfidibacter takaii TaxID=412593 RepID=UPI000838950B|nr:AarF/UbiB family protein [Thermosulfidibacter takaii]